MKQVLLVLVLTVAAAPSPVGQTTQTNPPKQNNNASTTDSNAEQEIRDRLNQDVQRSLSNNVESTIADFEQNYDKDYISVTASGMVYPLSEILKDIKENKSIPKFSSLKIDDVQIRMYGDTAVATYIRSNAMQSENKPISKDVRVSAVFIKRNGKWLRIWDQRSNIQTQNQSNQRQTSAPTNKSQ